MGKSFALLAAASLVKLRAAAIAEVDTKQAHNNHATHPHTPHPAYYALAQQFVIDGSHSMLIKLLLLNAMHPTHTIYAQGLSLVEALVTLSILATLTAFALPSLRDIHHKWQVQKAVHAMENSLLLARSEAIKHGGNIVLHKLSNDTHCKNATTKEEWGCGWFLFRDLNGSGTWTSTEPKLEEHALRGDVNVMHTSGGSNIKFNRYGMASGINAKGITFSPASTGVSSSATKTLCMATGGRIRTTDNPNCTQ